MDKIHKVSLIRRHIPTDRGLNMTFIPDDPECPSSRLSTELTDRERAEGRQKTAPAAYRGWLLGRLAAKEAAGRLWSLPAAAVEVLKGPDGAPVAASSRGTLAAGRVSISHTSDAAVAVAAEAPVGVDLERLDRQVSPRVWRWAFSPDEQKMLDGADGAYPPELGLWCAKEAAAKAWGRGLLNHLNRVRVLRADWPAGRITVGWVQDEAPADGADFVSEGPGLRAEVQLMVYGRHLAALARKVETAPAGAGNADDPAGSGPVFRR